jgi:sterol desaturase/sphingolipid hydroxylase (fatty acid hydroxylase superfamily)
MLHGLEVFRRWHLEHHRRPDLPLRTPLPFSLILVLVLALAPSLLWAGGAHALAFSGGMLAGHVLQEAVHHRLHQACPAEGWLAARWRHHTFHHQDNETLAFGTLTGVWDRLLGTARPAR